MSDFQKDFGRIREYALECWGKTNRRQAARYGAWKFPGIPEDFLTEVIGLVYDEMSTAILKDTKTSGDQYDPAIPIYTQLGVASDERLLVALVDEWPENAEIELVPDILAAGGTAVVGAEFETYGVRVIDVARADGAPVRWWQVRGVCSSEGLQELPTIYDGPADNVPPELFERRWSEENIGDLVFRLARQAPWIMLSRRPPALDKAAEDGYVDSPKEPNEQE